MKEFKHNKKFQSTVNKAKELFLKHGSKRVTIEEICTETPVSKMTFYKFFKNKNELIKFILEQMMKEGIEKYRKIMEQKVSYPEKIKQMVILKHESTKAVSDEFIKEIFQNKQHDLIQIIQTYQDKSTSLLMHDLQKAQNEGWIRKDLNPKFMLYMLHDLNNKLFDPNLENLYSNKHDLIMEITNYFFYGIMNKRESSL
ncbi:MAG: TetR/AcrR family transcriptional regulator [Bacteroidales bacterium]|nr:TetR/AcrR family transcriptional regulator [Bacteroidales bacterium]